jgi:hypothetical protein
MGVFFRALILAEKECAPEIRVDHLLAALDVAPTEETPVPPSAGPLLPCPKREMFFSSEAEARIESVGGIEGATVDRLRSALLAKSEGARRSSDIPTAENGT